MSHRSHLRWNAEHRGASRGAPKCKLSLTINRTVEIGESVLPTRAVGIIPVSKKKGPAMVSPGRKSLPYWSAPRKRPVPCLVISPTFAMRKRPEQLYRARLARIEHPKTISAAGRLHHWRQFELPS
jgi:hypothetical protein